MPKKKKPMTAFQKRAKANVAANRKGFVTGPKGGAETATRIGKKQPRTSGPGVLKGFKTRLLSGTEGRGFANRKDPAFGKMAGGKKPQTDVQRGLKAIKDRKARGTQIESQALGKQRQKKKDK
jgi:hypothetical protein